MENRQIIEKILIEWAFRSPDGLAGGYDTVENIDVIRNILMENGLSESDIAEFSALIEKSPAEKAVAKNIKGGKPVEIPDVKGEKDDPRFSKEANQKLRHYASPEGKGIRKDDFEYVKDALAKYDKDEKFMGLYNSLSLNQAIDTYGFADYASIINAIDKRVRMGLGRGELVFLFMLKDYRSGGTADVDLLYAEVSGNIEMKELTGTSKKKIMKISAPTLKGYSASDFKAAIDELSVSLHKEPKLGPFLERVFVGTNAETNQPLYPSPEAKNITDKQVSALHSFIKERKTTEMSKTLFEALAIIIEKLALSDKSKPKDKISAARASIVIGKDNQEFRVENPQDVKKDMENVVTNPKQKTDIKLKVSLGATRSDAELEQMAKNLAFFKEKYTVPKISKEITALVGGKYKGLLVIDKRNGNSATFYPKGTPFLFLNLTMNGIKITPEKESVSDADVEKV